MNLLILICGIILLVLALVESLWTTLWVDGNSGPLTSRLTTWTWKLFKAIFGLKRHRLLSLAGPTILFLSILMWILLLWLGWSMMLYSDSSSLIDVRRYDGVTFLECIWFTAYTLFTVGNGDFTPTPGIWQIACSLAALTGLVIVTLSVTYILQVLAAISNKRSFASQVTSLGNSAEEWVISQWNSKDFGRIELQLNSINGQLARLTEQHLAFPILHYYHSKNADRASTVATGILDDALSILAFGVEEKYRPDHAAILTSRRSVQNFLKTLRSAFISPAGESPSLPDLARLRDAGIPVVPEEDFYKSMKQLEERRKITLGMIWNDAWQWPPVK